jgi:hypothetical protein
MAAHVGGQSGHGAADLGRPRTQAAPGGHPAGACDTCPSARFAAMWGTGIWRRRHQNSERDVAELRGFWRAAA